MRKKKLLSNMLSSLIYQITAILCGFVLPNLILRYYGSNVNGLVNSVNEFLRIITFLDLGVGTVVCSNFYKPLAQKNDDEISKIYKSAKRYFNNIAKLIIIYILLLPILFSFFINKGFDFIFNMTLIFSMGISSFSQYYFGMVNQLLITADQKGYIQYNLQTVTLIINTIVCSILICKGTSIQIVKLTTSFIFLFRPIYLAAYVKKNYNINKNIKYKVEPIKQKWNGLFQHLAAVVLDSTDTIILTIFSTLSNVSIYSVYFLVIHGIRQLIQSFTNGIQSLLGNMIAKKETDKLNIAFNLSEFGIHVFTTFSFGCVLVLIVPFVMVYTKDIKDINYIVPLFGIILTIAHACYCYRLPYHLVIKAAGMYKETQNNYIIAMFINIVLSVLFVKISGLIGVAIGTLAAMLFQTIWMANFCSKKIINREKQTFLKQFFIDVLTLLIGYFATCKIVMKSINYFSFIILCLKVSLLWIIIIAIINLIFYKKQINEIKNVLLKNYKKKEVRI